MKKLLVGVLCIVIMMTSFVFAAEVYERPDFNIFVDGVAVDKTDVPIVIDGRTLVPLRTLAVALGVPNDNDHIIWNAETRNVTVINENVNINLTIDSTDAIVNNEAKTIDVPATVYNGRTYLPARFVAEAFNKEVGWDGETGTITINDRKVDMPVLGDETSENLVRRAMTSMESVKSMKADIDLSIDMPVENVSAKIEMKGPVAVDLNDEKIYADLDVSTSVLGLSFVSKTMLYSEQGETYVRSVEEANDSGWLKEESMSINFSDIIDNMPSIQGEFYDGFEVVGVENGKTIVKLKDGMDEKINPIIEKALSVNLGQELIEGATSKVADLQYEMHINNATSYVDKVDMSIAMETETTAGKAVVYMSIVLNMSEFNTVKIERPM